MPNGYFKSTKSIDAVVDEALSSDSKFFKKRVIEKYNKVSPTNQNNIKEIMRLLLQDNGKELTTTRIYRGKLETKTQHIFKTM